MRRTQRWPAAATLCATLWAATIAAAASDPEPAATGRRLQQEFGQAVVTVSVVMQMGGQNGAEQEGEALGTVISPDGLVAVPLYAIDPGEASILHTEMVSPVDFCFLSKGDSSLEIPRGASPPFRSHGLFYLAFDILSQLGIFTEIPMAVHHSSWELAGAFSP